MFSFINFATVIVFLVTMFDDSTQLVTVPRSSPDPIAELCRALVVLKRERFHIREVFKLSSDGHTEKFNTVRSTGNGPYFLDIDMPIIDQSVNVQSYGGDVVRDLVSKRLGIDIYYVRHLD